MSVGIVGKGWVPPLGSDITEVWNRLRTGDQPELHEVQDPLGEKVYPAYRVPASALKSLPPHPRLRRASAISRFAAAAGLAALKDANLMPDEKLGQRLALIFAVANGGVIYTKRFYDDIVKTGADAASPLLFPETVFNAAASHLAAIIGLTGATYTVVGDGAVGLTAVKMADDLLADPDLEYCLIVAAEEADWLLCDAYRKWRLLRSGPPIEVYGRPKGTILSEGAGALVLSRTGRVRIVATAGGAHFRKRTDASAVLAETLQQIGSPSDAVVITSANGTFIDKAEITAVKAKIPNATLYSPKVSLGDGVAASSLWQLIVATEALRTQEMPLTQYPPSQQTKPAGGIKLSDCREISVLCCGMNQQTGAARLSLDT